MNIGERTSTTQLATKLSQTLGQRSAAIERINAAVPTEWVRGRKGEQVVEVKRTVATKKGLPNTVEMRLATGEQGIAEEPSTVLVRLVWRTVWTVVSTIHESSHTSACG